MKTNKKIMKDMLKEVLDETNHSKSKFSINPYGSQGKKYFYLYHIKKNKEGM